jgi:hypothetical protein
MLSRPLPRFAIVATVLFFFASGPYFAQAARADDAAKTAHEAAVLDRIFANWKARSDRVDSLHFRWDCRTTFKQGAIDPSSDTRPRARFEREQVFEQRGAEFWLDGDDRMCLVQTPTFKLPHAKSIDAGRLVSRWVVDERTTARFVAGPEFETGGGAGLLAPNAYVHPTFQDVGGFVPDELWPFLLTFRPPHPAIRWLKKHSRVIDENASIDNIRCIKLQAVLEASPSNEVEERFVCFVSPARADVVVHWAILNPVHPPEPEPSFRVDWSIKYKTDQKCGWLPSEWTIETKDSLNEYKVTDYAINARIDPGVFSLAFPPGTLVAEQPRRTTLKHRHYVVQADGSKREISADEYLRLLKSTQPVLKPAPEKPRAK